MPRRTSNAPIQQRVPWRIVLELTADRSTGCHRDVGVTPSRAWMPRLLVDAHDVLGARRLVIDAQDIVALLPEFVVVRGQVHLPLPSMRLQVRVAENARYGAVANLDALRTHVLAEQWRRPVRDGQPNIAWRPDRPPPLLVPRRHPRERGRASRSRGVRQLVGRMLAIEPATPLLHRRDVDAEQLRDVRSRYPVRHHEHGLRPTNHALLRLRGARRRLDLRAFLRAQSDGDRRTTTVRSTSQRPVVDQVEPPLHRSGSDGKESCRTFCRTALVRLQIGSRHRDIRWP